MKVVVCDDEQASLLRATLILQKLGYEVLSFNNAHDALMTLCGPNPPKMAVLDWMMPQFSGIDICRRVRKNSTPISVYIVILTAKGRPEDVEEALMAGANDYICKPFEPVEFKARMAAGARIVQLENDLKTIRGLLPICAWCKKVRVEDDNNWMRIEDYIERNSYAQFTHGGCPECLAKQQGPLK